MTLRAIHAARLGGGTADSYDDAPREPRAIWWGMTALQIATAITFGLFFFDGIRVLLLFVALMGGGV
jgi:hypothetical protein